MQFSEVTFGSPAYEHTLSLRKRILRDPLRLEWSEEEKAWEARERHFALREDGRVIACVVARDLGEHVFKLRQMAVEPLRQKAGLGRELLERVEGLLIGEAAKPEVLAKVRRIVGAEHGVDRINEILTMHMGPQDVLLNLSLDFRSSLSSDQVEAEVTRLERQIKAAFPEITRVFIEAQSRMRGRR